MKKAYLFLLLITSVLICHSQDNFDLSSKVPIDTSIIKGKLDNGLTYYIKENKMPENRVQMRLVVNAGSILEEDDQLGIAHFLEHMCFNGTKNFEKQSLVDFLEKTGVKFGPDLNAYTSFDETVYYFQLPSERESLLDSGLLVLNDWAHNATLNEEEIEKEKGVVIEEWRLGLGADDRMMKKWLPIALKDSRYEKRIPIGEKEIIETFNHEKVNKFYKDWYRPDLMAVVIVGDIDKKAIESKVKKVFSDIELVENPRERTLYDIPNNKDPLVAIALDKEAPYIQLQLEYKHDKVPEGTIGVYKEFIMRQLFNGMMVKRLNELVQKPEAPFLYAVAYYNDFLGRSKDSYSSFAVAKEKTIIESLQQLILENNRVKTHGFMQGELDRQKKEIISSYEQALKELGKTESNSYSDEFSRNYLTKEPIPGIKKEYEYVQYFLPKITLEDINALAKKWIIDDNLVVIMTGPERERLKYPTEEEIIETINTYSKKEVEGYIDIVDDSPLIEKTPKKGKIKKEIYHDDFDYHEFVLSNGAKVFAKITDYKNDEVLFSAFSYGGESLYDLNDLFSVRYADAITQISGVDKVDNITLNKKMAGSTASLGFGINKYDENISGSCAPEDMTDLFQLLYLYTTKPRKDETAFAAYISRIENEVKFLEADPSSVFNDTLTKILNSNSPRSLAIIKPEHIAQIDNQRVYDIFRERFSNPADFRYVFIGNINLDTLKKNLEYYIASVPSIKKTEKWKDIESVFPDGKTDFTFYKGIDPQALVYLFMKGDMKWTREERIKMQFLNNVLSIRLREKIREDEGGTYGVRVNVRMTDIPDPKYTFTIGFGCNPEKADTLYNEMRNELSSIVEKGPTAEEMSKVKETFIRSRETDMKTNNFWASVILNKDLKGDNILSFEKYKQEISKITLDEIKEMAEKYIDLNSYVHAILLPENMRP